MSQRVYNLDRYHVIISFKQTQNSKLALLDYEYHKASFDININEFVIFPYLPTYRNSDSS